MSFIQYPEQHRNIKRRDNGNRKLELALSQPLNIHLIRANRAPPYNYNFNDFLNTVIQIAPSFRSPMKPVPQ